MTISSLPRQLPAPQPRFGFHRQTHEWVTDAAIAEYMQQFPDTPMTSFLLDAGVKSRLVIASGKTDERSHKEKYAVRPQDHFINPDSRKKGDKRNTDWMDYERRFAHGGGQPGLVSILDPNSPLLLKQRNLYTGLLETAGQALVPLRKLFDSSPEARRLDDSYETMRLAVRKMGDACHLLTDMHAPLHVTIYQPEIGNLSLHRDLEAIANRQLRASVASASRSGHMYFPAREREQLLQSTGPIERLPVWAHGILSDSYKANTTIAGIMRPVFQQVRQIEFPKRRRLPGPRDDQSADTPRAAKHIGKRRQYRGDPPRQYQQVVPDLARVMKGRVDGAIKTTVELLRWLDTKAAKTP